MSDRTIQDVISSALRAESEGVPVSWKEITLSAVEVFQREYEQNQATIRNLKAEVDGLDTEPALDAEP